MSICIDAMDAERTRTWAEIDLDCLEHNLRQVKLLTGGKTKIMGVVKADAYGHGAVTVSTALLQNGVDRLAVACVEEAMELRRNGIGCPVQVLGQPSPIQASRFPDFDLIATVSDEMFAGALSDAACRRRKKAKAHIKLDTGMGRYGFPAAGQTVEQIVRISELPNLELEGIMTHFSSADERNGEYTARQFELFMNTCDCLHRQGIRFEFIHAANSAAIVNYKPAHLDMVRPGIMLYGYLPGSLDPSRYSFEPVMALKSRIATIQCIQKGSHVGYGRLYQAEMDKRIAIIPAGYADGFPRCLSNKGRIGIATSDCPVVGAVCMDNCMVDVTGCDGVATGMEAVLFGRKPDAYATADDIAKMCDTITYEILCGIGKRVPRIYVKSGSCHG